MLIALKHRGFGCAHLVCDDTSVNVGNIPAPGKWVWSVARATTSAGNQAYVAEFERPTDFMDGVTILRLDVLVNLLLFLGPLIR